MLGPALVTMLDRMLWFIVFFRVREGWPTFSIELETTVHDLRRSRYASWEIDHPIRNARARRQKKRQLAQGTYDEIVKKMVQPVRVLCMPPEPAKASDEDWSRAKRLSSALTHVIRPGGPNDLPEPLSADAQHSSGWTAILVPVSIDYEKVDTVRDQILSRQIDSWLTSLAGEEVDDQIRWLTRER
jgi:hypothetical protein